MRTTIWSTLALIAVFLVWYIAADRMTPITSNARVKTVITQIVPQVSGNVTEVLVENGQLVSAGDVLIRIDRRSFEIDLQSAEADLEAATQEVGASSADVSAAQAVVARAQADLDTLRIQSERVFALEKRGLVTAVRADDARKQLAEAEADLDNAIAGLDRAKQLLGVSGDDNPKIQRALSAIAQANLNLDRTELKAPADGVVSNLLVAPGTYAKSGRDILTLLGARDVWIEAYMTENNIGLAKVGSPAQIVLNMHPGRVLDGRIESFSGAVSVSGADTPESWQLHQAPRVFSENPNVFL